MRRRRRLGNSNYPPETDAHLEIAAALFLRVWVILLSTNVGAPTASFYGYLGSNHPAFTRPSTVAFQFIRQRMQANDDCLVFPYYSKPSNLLSRPSSLPTPLLTGPKPPTALHPLLPTPSRTTYLSTVQRRLRASAPFTPSSLYPP